LADAEAAAGAPDAAGLALAPELAAGLAEAAALPAELAAGFTLAAWLAGAGALDTGAEAPPHALKRRTSGITARFIAAILRQVQGASPAAVWGVPTSTTWRTAS
jgi:hypothetical protein